MLNNYNQKQESSSLKSSTIKSENQVWLNAYHLFGVNYKDDRGRSLLWLVTAYSNDEDLIMRIIDDGADLNVSALLAGEQFSISVAQLAKKRGFLKAYDKLISKQSSKIVVYVHLSSDYLSNHIQVTFYDHNLDYGIEVNPDLDYQDTYPKSIRRSTLIRRLAQSYTAFSFKAEIESLASILKLGEDLKKLNKFYHLFGGNCADLAMHLIPKRITESDFITCDFLTVCMPPIPSVFDYITNPNHVFKQIYSNVKNDLLFEHNTSWYTPRISVGDLLAYIPTFMLKSSKDFESEIKAIECKLSNNYKSGSATTKLHIT